MGQFVAFATQVVLPEQQVLVVLQVQFGQAQSVVGSYLVLEESYWLAPHLEMSSPVA